MMQSAGELEPSARMAAVAVERALTAPDGDVTPAVETQLHNALYALRTTSADHELLAWFEGIAMSLRMMAEAKRQGRTNFYMSRLLRLQRQVFR